jgi:hypothetical protein
MWEFKDDQNWLGPSRGGENKNMEELDATGKKPVFQKSTNQLMHTINDKDIVI